jgi:hypothetical protein
MALRPSVFRALAFVACAAFLGATGWSLAVSSADQEETRRGATASRGSQEGDTPETSLGKGNEDSGAHFSRARDGFWVSYQIEHQSSGVLQPRGTRVDGAARLRFYSLHSGARVVVVAVGVDALVRSGAEVLLGRGDVASLGGDAGKPTLSSPAPAQWPALDSALVKRALGEAGVVTFPVSPTLSPDFGAARFLALARGVEQDGSKGVYENLMLDALRGLAIGSPGSPPSASDVSFATVEMDDGAQESVRYDIRSRRSGAWDVRRSVSHTDSPRATVANASGAPSSAGTLRARVSDSRDITFVTSPFHVVSVDGVRTRMLSQGNAPLVENTHRWRVRRVATGVLDEALLLEVDLLLREAARSEVSSRTPNLERQMHEATLGDDTAATLLARLSELSSMGEGVTEAEKTDLYLKLKALIVLDPESGRTLVGRATDAGAGSLELQLLAGALSAAGTAAAQQALVDVLESAARGSRKRMELVPMLGMSENPSASTLLYLDAMSRDAASPEANAALLSLGIASHKARTVEGDIARRIALSMRDRLLAAREPREIRNLLAAGGNAGDGDVLRAAATFLASADPSVRAAAIFALRSVPFEEFKSSYERALSDPDERVRESALRGLEAQRGSPQSVAFLIDAFGRQESTRMRVGVLNLLWRVRRVSPDVKEFVEGVADDSTNADVQKLASRLLSEGP